MDMIDRTTSGMCLTLSLTKKIVNKKFHFPTVNGLKTWYWWFKRFSFHHYSLIRWIYVMLHITWKLCSFKTPFSHHSKFGEIWRDFLASFHSKKFWFENGVKFNICPFLKFKKILNEILAVEKIVQKGSIFIR